MKLLDVVTALIVNNADITQKDIFNTVEYLLSDSVCMHNTLIKIGKLVKAEVEYEEAEV